MSQDVAPPPSRPSEPKRRRGVMPRLSENPDTRSIQIGVAGTILIHLLLLLFAPGIFHQEAANPAAYRHIPQHFNVTLLPPPPHAVPIKPAMRYVEANPNAPENTPDHTNNVSDRNQRVAQEKPTPKGKNDMPTTQGRKDIQSIQIVNGQLTKPQESTPPVPRVQMPRQAQARTARKAQNPLAGIDKTKGADATGFATNIGKKLQNQTPVDHEVEGAAQGPQMTSFSAGIPAIDPRRPQERELLEQQVRPAVFADNKYGTSNIGVQALDARWSNYGVYMKKLTETVQIEWDRILDESAIYPQSGNSVTVSFVLNSKGQITKVTDVQATPGTSDEAKAACVSGITNRAPYGAWSDDMISVLGNEQPLTFTFFYQ